MDARIVDAEAKWIERAKLGDEAAFTKLVRDHQARVYRVCLAALGDSREADEAAQDVFVRMHEKLRSFRGESRLSTWLYRVALNVCADRRRIRRWRNWIEVDLPESIPDRRARPDDRMEGQEAVERLQEALNRLDQPFRDILILRELEERDYAEIAAILGISIGTVESRLFRARKKLKQLLDPLAED